jgi:hypothetical protein
MDKRGPLILGFNILMCGTVTAFNANEIHCSVTADYFGKYIWRGQNVSNRSVFQPSVSLSSYGFTGSFWGNMDLTGQNKHRNEFIELNYILDYSAAMPGIDWLNFSMGTIHYQFPNTSYRPTTEVYGGLSFDVPLTPSIKVFRDVDETDGTYIMAAIEHKIGKIATFSDDCYCGLQLGSGIGWGNSAYNTYFFAINDGKSNDLVFSAGFPICMGKWTIKPGINYSMMLSDAVRSATDKSDNIWMVLSVSREL